MEQLPRQRGDQRCPRPINTHASTKDAGYWGPRRSARGLWLRLEAKPERALGPGATVGVLGMGVPRLARLRPTVWLYERARMAHLHQQGIQDPREGTSLARRTTQDLLGSGLTMLVREGRRDQGKANLAKFS